MRVIAGATDLPYQMGCFLLTKAEEEASVASWAMRHGKMLGTRSLFSIRPR